MRDLIVGRHGIISDNEISILSSSTYVGQGQKAGRYYSIGICHSLSETASQRFMNLHVWLPGIYTI